MDEEGNGWTNVCMKLPMIYLGEKREKRGNLFKILEEKRKGWMKKAVWMNYGKQENTYYSLGWKEGGEKGEKTNKIKNLKNGKEKKEKKNKHWSFIGKKKEKGWMKKALWMRARNYIIISLGEKMEIKRRKNSEGGK